MTVLDDTLPAKVATIVAKYGKTLTFHANASDAQEASYDPTTGEAGTPSGTTYDYKATPPEGAGRRWKEDLIQLEDQETWLPASGLNATFKSDNLRPGMLVVFDGVTYVAAAVVPYRSGNDIAVYHILLRRRGG
jgi:hypothetical protein